MKSIIHHYAINLIAINFPIYMSLLNYKTKTRSFLKIKNDVFFSLLKPQSPQLRRRTKKAPARKKNKIQKI